MPFLNHAGSVYIPVWREEKTRKVQCRMQKCIFMQICSLVFLMNLKFKNTKGFDNFQTPLILFPGEEQKNDMALLIPRSILEIRVAGNNFYVV